MKRSSERLLAAPYCGRSLSFIEDTAGMTEGGFKLKCLADAARETVQSHDLCCHLICGCLLIATVSVLEMELKACITSGERWWTSRYLTVQPTVCCPCCSLLCDFARHADLTQFLAFAI